MTFSLGNFNTAASNPGSGTTHSYKIPNEDTIGNVVKIGYFDGLKHIVKAGDRINLFEQSTGKFQSVGVTKASKTGVEVAVLNELDVRAGQRVAIAGFGDSRISFDSSLSSTTYSRNAYGYITWANYFLNERFVYSNALDLGVSGDSTTAMVARLTDIDAALAAEPDLKAIVFQGGTNDANSAVATATVTGNYTTIFDYILGKGLMLYILEEFPRNTWSSSDPAVIDVAQKALLDYNAFYATFQASHPDRVRVLPVYDAFRDGYDTRKSNTSYVQSDGVHQELNGAMIVGRLLSQELRSDFGMGTFPDINREFVNTNPFLRGTGGTNSTANLTLTGASVIPANWTLGSSVTSGPINTATVSRTTDGAFRISMNLGAGGATSSLIRLEQTVTLASGAYVLGDLMQCVADIKPVSGTNLKAVGLQLLDDTSGTDYTYQGMWRTNATNFNAEAAGRGLVATDRFKVQSNNTQLRIRLELTVDATTAAAAAVDVYALGVLREKRVSNKALTPYTTAVGNVGTGEDNLITHTLPANTLNAAGKGVRITAWGTGANNANAKTLKLYFGTQVVSTLTMTTSQVNKWRVVSEVISTGTDTQDWNSHVVQSGTAVQNVCDASTATQDDGAAITIKCTGQATTDNDIVQEGMLVEVIG